MKIPAKKTLTFTYENTAGEPRNLTVSEPTVAQLENFIAIDEGTADEDSPRTRARRIRAQFLALAGPPPCPIYRPAEWLANYRRRREIRRTVADLTQTQFATVLNALLAAAHGLDIEAFEKLQEEDKKKEEPEPETDEGPTPESLGEA
jgi:hypothetical protein